MLLPVSVSFLTRRIKWSCPTRRRPLSKLHPGHVEGALHDQRRLDQSRLTVAPGADVVPPERLRCLLRAFLAESGVVEASEHVSILWTLVPTQDDARPPHGWPAFHRVGFFHGFGRAYGHLEGAGRN